MIFDTWEHFAETRGVTPDDAARILHFMSHADENTPDGTYELDGMRCRASVSHYDTKVRAEAKFEYHRQFIDVQTLLSGREFLLATTEKTLDIEPFSTVRDCGFRAVPQEAPVAFPLAPGRFILLNPEESHAPGVRIDERRAVRVVKIVFKIAIDRA